MKLLKFLELFLAAAILSLCVASCNDSDELQDSSDGITGSWYGTRYYNNGTKQQYLSIDFGSDKTGSYEYTSPVSFSTGKFTYNISGNIIICKGVNVSTSDSSVNTDFSWTLELRDNKLYPLDLFDLFVLSKEGSYTNAEGEEIIDQSDWLTGVWVETIHGESVIEFDENIITEYTIDKNTHKCINVSLLPYSYNFVTRTLIINGTKWDIAIFTQDVLQIYMTGRTFCYERGSSKDIPK